MRPCQIGDRRLMWTYSEADLTAGELRRVTQLLSKFDTLSACATDTRRPRRSRPNASDIWAARTLLRSGPAPSSHTHLARSSAAHETLPATNANWSLDSGA